ncbi:MAG: hypothetical protein L3J05_00395 [Robiginitomaculum sp.]|nr:hypothetical protein [Robiginitomaculum sp.]
MSDAFVQMGLGSFGVMLPSLLLISLLLYPYLCLYGKRLRDVGISAWWFLIVMLVYVVAWVGLANASNALMGQMNFSPMVYFLDQIKITADMSVDETVATIRGSTQKVLIYGAVFTALLHVIIVIAIDLVLGKLRPKHDDNFVASAGAVIA